MYLHVYTQNYSSEQKFALNETTDWQASNAGLNKTQVSMSLDLSIFDLSRNCKETPAMHVEFNSERSVPRLLLLIYNNHI